MTTLREANSGGPGHMSNTGSEMFTEIPRTIAVYLRFQTLREQTGKNGRYYQNLRPSID